MSTHKIKCPHCNHEFTEEHIHLVEKKKKEITESDELTDLAPKVKDLIAKLSSKEVSIEKITLIAADKENQLRQKNNPGMSLEVHIVPDLEPR